MEIQKTEDITEFIKLGKNSRGYTWEIKVSGLATEKLKEINTKLEETYGVEND